MKYLKKNWPWTSHRTSFNKNLKTGLQFPTTVQGSWKSITTKSRKQNSMFEKKFPNNAKPKLWWKLGNIQDWVMKTWITNTHCLLSDALLLPDPHFPDKKDEAWSRWINCARFHCSYLAEQSVKAGLELKFITTCQNPWEVANVFLADITVRPS